MPLATSKEPHSHIGGVGFSNALGFTLSLRTTSTLLRMASRRMRSLVSATSFSIGLAVIFHAGGGLISRDSRYGRPNNKGGSCEQRQTAVMSIDALVSWSSL